MAILDRISTLVRANISDLLDKAEDPEKVIKQLILDMNNQLVQAKQQVVTAIADQERLYQRHQEAQQNADDWQKRAELAVSKGSDDLAKEALARRNTYQQTADGFKQQYEEQKAQVDQLKDALRQLEAKIQEAEAKKDILIARSRRAKAEVEVRETVAGISQTSAVSEFGRMEEKVAAMEARAKATTELEGETTEERFAKLEDQEELDRQLAELKAKAKGSEETTPPS